MNLAKSGADALSAGDAATAVTQYTRALLQHPTSPDYLAQRSTAFVRLKPARYDLALRDAELAVLCGRKRSSRKHIQAAQLRRVVALYHSGRYAEAKHVLDTMQRWLPKEAADGEERVKAAMSGTDSRLLMETKIWLNKVTRKLAEAGNGQPAAAAAAAAAATSSEYPEGSDSDVAEATLLKLYKSQLKADGTFDFDWQPGQEASTSTATTRSSASTAAAGSSSSTATSAVPAKIRHEWYQNAQSVIITIYAKGVSKDKAQIDIQDDSLSVSFPQPSDPTAVFSFTLDPLHALVDAAGSTATIMSTKVEITLKKAAPGVKWPALEGTEPLQKQASSSTASDPAARAAVYSSLQSGQQPSSATPVYPTSSKSGPKNWDKLAKDLTKKTKAAETTGGGNASNHNNDDDDANDNDGDDDDDDEFGGDAVDGFFKKLYKGADADTRRAMMKSFQESNGTALSTNWAEVGSKHYDPVEEKRDDD